MEIGKLPFEKVFYFIAGLIPGSMALFIYYLANPWAFHPFLEAPYLGYRTKLWIAIGLGFVLGNTLMIFIGSFLGAIGGVLGTFAGTIQYAREHALESAPWRERGWRKLAIRYLGERAPSDTHQMSRESFDLNRSALDQLPDAVRPQAIITLVEKREQLASDDQDWSRWYSQIDRQRRAEHSYRFEVQVAEGLRSSLQTTAIYVLTSMIFVPKVRNWISASYCAFWALIMVVEMINTFRSYSNPWNTWSEQLDYLARGSQKAG